MAEETHQVSMEEFQIINLMQRDIEWRIAALEQRQQIVLKDPVAYRAFAPLKRVPGFPGESPHWRTIRGQSSPGDSKGP